MTARFFEPDLHSDFWLASGQNLRVFEVRWRFDASALRFSVKRWTKLLLALVGLAVLGVASISFVVNANTFRPSIETQLTTTFGRSVKFGDLSLSFFSARLIARDLSVADDPNFNAAPFLTAKENPDRCLDAATDFLA